MTVTGLESADGGYDEADEEHATEAATGNKDDEGKEQDAGTREETERTGCAGARSIHTGGAVDEVHAS